MNFDKKINLIFINNFILKIALLILFILSLINLVVFSGNWSGDPEIHLVFSKNLINGNFLQFNPGEMTSGNTSPIYMIILSILLKILPDIWVPFIMKLFSLSSIIALSFLVSKELCDKLLIKNNLYLLFILFSFLLLPFIFFLAALYTIRIGGGSLATGIQISFWLIAFSLFIFLSLAAVKRQSELVHLINNKQFKIQGRDYNADDLPIISMITISTGISSVLLSTLYINSTESLILYSKIWTLEIACFVLFFWLMRIIFNSKRGIIHSDPILYAVKDGFSILCFLTIFSLFAINFI